MPDPIALFNPPVKKRRRRRSTLPSPTIAPPSTNLGVPPAPTFNVPDYLQLASQTPGYLAELARFRENLGQQQAAGSADITRQLISLGIVPPNISPEAGTLTEGLNFADIAAQAQANPFSIWANLQRAYDENRRRTFDVIGGRGLAGSGEVPYQIGQLDIGTQQQRSNALQDFLDYLSGAQSAFQQSKLGAPSPAEFVPEAVALNPPTIQEPAAPAGPAVPPPTNASSLSRPSWINPQQWLRMSRRQRLQALQGLSGYVR